ncbi:hypothetical protein KIH74_28745 [Kineosporia sp. J2-2]|uniref:RES domain-containing protein n=1 Tax=Kineosporia corallincola TaxID=2835133 RepID=A0ABS5TPE0_9ACTN|nr:hypothetical protein [Kineosporia corallincola]MBT0772966.1 hypothetical protein [Kineosporia corallincola]
MLVTTLTLDAAEHLPRTHLLRDETAALALLRQLLPDTTRNVPDPDLVHHLTQEGIRVRIETHELSPLLQPGLLPPGPYGDLYRVGANPLGRDDRRGEFLRPATPHEAALSHSCARLDAGAGIFGVRTSYPPGPKNTASVDYLHHGSHAWENALAVGTTRYYRVEAIPDDATLPALPGDIELPPR